MATYKKNEVKLVDIYRVEIDYYLDQTVFNGEYLKNKDGQLVYFGLQNVDGDYLNKLSDVDLTNCITSEDDNYTINLEKVEIMWHMDMSILIFKLFMSFIKLIETNLIML